MRGPAAGGAGDRSHGHPAVCALAAAPGHRRAEGGGDGGGMLHAMFPRRIHAVTQEGFAIKVLSFVLAHNLKLLTQEMA